MNLLEKKSDFYIINFVQSKHKVPDNWNQESPDIKKREASHGCWTAKAQMKVPQKRKLVDSFNERCNVKIVNLIYLLLLSLADCYSRGKPLPNASFLSGGVQDQRLTLCQIYRALNTESGLLIEQLSIGLQLRGRAVVSKAARREFDSCQPWTRRINAHI